ncbi:MAG TPA: type IV toxin-antitoxin system AbiEi family antitoxin domain-containing protein [Gemmatimonadaceae bacterium]|nr:type IV toxin-antitoxin system AbiEi family antitoxin domain-containing protein [Gemmatimonadaceae bacterium]
MFGTLAARQHGVVSRGQLLDAGVTATMIDKRVARGRLVPLHRGVYAVGHAHLRPNGYRLAAVLAVGPGAALSHRDAAALHGIRDGGGTRIDVSTPAERRSTRRIRVHGRRRLDPRDVMSIEGIPVTTIARTLVDLGEVLAHQPLTKAVGEAERQRALDVRGIEEVLGRVRGRRGRSLVAVRAALSELAAHGTQLTRSPLEDRLLPLLDARDLPRPATNAYVEGYECDAVWHRQRLVVELDGWDAHKTRRAFQHDRTKANALTNAGWAVLRFTHADVAGRPHETAAAIAAQLSRAAGSARPPRAAARPAS